MLGEQLLHDFAAERADELAFQVRIAYVEAELPHRPAREMRAEAGPLERTAEARLLTGVAETREPDLAPFSAYGPEGVAERLRAPDRNDGDALAGEVAIAPPGEGLQRDLVAHPLDEHERRGIEESEHGANDGRRMTPVVPTSEWPYQDRQPWLPMDAQEVVRLIELAAAAGVEVWIDGGWGVDALLEEQTREHDDLDVVVELKLVFRFEEALRPGGYRRAAGAAPKSFVLVDARGRQVDVHPVRFDPARGGGVYEMDDGREWVYPASGFAGRGRIGARSVRCLSPEVQVLVHDGYELTEKDYYELHLLHARFGVEIPARYAKRARAAGAER